MRQLRYAALPLLCLILLACQGEEFDFPVSETKVVAPTPSPPFPARPQAPPADLGLSSLSHDPNIVFPGSPFHQPIGPDPEIDPDSDAYIERLTEVAEETGFNLAVRSFSVTVFEARPEDPVYDVQLTAEWAPHQTLGPVPIPRHAVPDPEDDGHMVVVDSSSGCAFEFWQARRVGDRWAASWANSISLDSNGIYSQGGAARAGGSSLLEGLIWPEELRTGRIRHALVFAYGETRAGGPVPPATSSDGWSWDPQALPQGARLQLDPAFDVSTLPDWQQPIARALQEYGMFLMDTTGGDISLFALNPLTLASDPYEDLIPDSVWFGDRPGARDWARLDIPAQAFRVLKLPPQTANPTELTPPACGRTSGGWRFGVWSVAVDGTTAYLASGINGLQVLDVSNPERPALLSTFAPEFAEPGIRVQVADKTAYLSTAGTGVLITDLSDPSAPALMAEFGGEDEFYFTAMALQGETLYLADVGNLFLLDVSDPRRPTVLGGLEESDLVADPRDMVVIGDLVLLADGFYGLTVIDVSQPERPLVLGMAEDFAEGVAAADGFVYLTDHDLGFHVLDISDPARPVEVGGFDLEDFGYGLVVQEGLALVANGLGGLQVLDVSDPANPRRLSQVVDLPGYALDVALSGDYAYVALQDGGLAILDLSDPARPSVVGRYAPFD